MSTETTDKKPTVINSEELIQYVIMADFKPDLHNIKPKTHVLWLKDFVGEGMVAIVGDSNPNNALPHGGLTSSNADKSTVRIDKNLSLLKLYLGMREHNQLVSTEKLNKYEEALWEWTGSESTSFYSNYRVGVVKIETTFSELA